LRATLCALIVALAAWPLAARSDDYGPRRDIAAIRHDLPILVQMSDPVLLDNIAVTGNEATVHWHSSGDSYISHLQKRYDRWWLASGFSDPCVSPWDGTISFTQNYPLRAANDGYVVGVQFGPNDASPNAMIVSFKTRAPTEAESWANQPTGNSYFFFSGTVQSTQPVHVQAGTTIDVWFPFVLDTSLKYSLTLAGHGFTALGPIDGTLADNTLHFVLPAFTASPGVDLMGEIEND
jgi:hypothetical protein